MPSIPLKTAIERLSAAVHGMRSDDVHAVFDELFPEDVAGDVTTSAVIADLTRRIDEHIMRGLEPEEVVDLWNVVYPDDRAVYFDDETDLLCYVDESEVRT
jgi:hypothetical protein